MTILALTGGIGGAKLSVGLAHILPPSEVTFVVNVGDDFEHLGLNISPDIDTLTYTLAGIVDESTGWGRTAESWNCLTELKRFQADTWFQLGDRDLALHLFRTAMLKSGKSLTETTRIVCERLGVSHEVVPVTDGSLRTFVATDQGLLPFQDYFVRLKCEPRVSAVEFQRESPVSMSSAIRKQDVAGVVICPSNPFLSVDPLLVVEEMSSFLLERDFPVVAVSPIVGNTAIKGPTAKMMGEMGMSVSCTGVAQHYKNLIDGYIIDPVDAPYAHDIEELGIHVLKTPSIMRTFEDKVTLAKACVGFVEQLRQTQ